MLLFGVADVHLAVSAMLFRDDFPLVVILSQERYESKKKKEDRETVASNNV